MSQSEQDYLRARAAQERALIEEGTDELAQSIHRKLARAYEARLRESSAAERNDNEKLDLTSDGGRSS